MDAAHGIAARRTPSVVRKAGRLAGEDIVAAHPDRALGLDARSAEIQQFF
jgi:hypothetical protein